MTCSDLSINERLCNANYTPSRDLCGVQAFVLHGIPGYTLQEYLSFVREPFTRGRYYYTSFPKSVHFVIDQDGSVYQLIYIHNRAWGITVLHNPSWSLLNYCNWEDFEDLFIHIGFIGGDLTESQIDAAYRLICCQIVDNRLNIDVNTGVIVARDLDTRLECLWRVPDNLIPRAYVCIQQEGIDPLNLTDIGQYGSQIGDLQDAQEATSTQVDGLITSTSDLQTQVDAIQSSLDALQLTVEGLNFDSLMQRITDLEAGNFNILKAITIIQNCLDCAGICEEVTPISIKYRLDAADTVKLVPGTIQHLNLPVKVLDVDPPIVTTGPLWYAELKADAQVSCTTFKVKASARLSTADWCPGRTLELYAVINFENILLNAYTATAGSQSAAVYGETIFTIPPDADAVVYLGLRTDDDTTPLEVVMASIEIECLDGVLTPNCSDCSD